MKYTIDPKKLYATLADMDSEERGKYLLVACMEMMADRADFPWIVKEKKSSRYDGKGCYSDEFEQFWSLYPRRIGKGAAYLSWKRIDMDKHDLLMICQLALDWQRASEQWTKESGKWIPHPTTYLNQRRWEDERVEIKSEVMGIGPSKTGRQMVL